MNIHLIAANDPERDDPDYDTIYELCCSGDYPFSELEPKAYTFNDFINIFCPNDNVEATYVKDELLNYLARHYKSSKLYDFYDYPEGNPDLYLMNTSYIEDGKIVTEYKWMRFDFEPDTDMFIEWDWMENNPGKPYMK